MQCHFWVPLGMCINIKELTHYGRMLVIKRIFFLTLTICECSKTCILIYWCIVCKFGKYHHVHRIYRDRDNISICNRFVELRVSQSFYEFVMSTKKNLNFTTFLFLCVIYASFVTFPILPYI